MRSGGKTRPKRRDTGILLIAIFKLAKGLILLFVGLGVAALLHNGVEAELDRWANVLWVGRESRMVEKLIDKIVSLGDKNLRLTELGTFVYAALLLTEGTGLLLRRRWAEYLTTVITASFIPFEIWILTMRFSVEKLIVLLINIAVVWYLVRKIRREKAKGDDHG
jgi:uncharacterized membrane protein (DUF2068 family)